MAQESIRSAPALRLVPMAPAFEKAKMDPDPEIACATARLPESRSQDTDNEHAKNVDLEDRMAEQQGNESHALIRDTKGIGQFLRLKKDT
jgi:hypothetical protein